MNYNTYLEKAKTITQQLSLEEKVLLLQGKDFWHTNGLEKYGIKELMLTDGPYGLRKQALKSDHIGLNQSEKSVCYPTGSCAANSFNRDLFYAFGEEIAKECIKEDIAMILGPAINHKRLLNCGRNFEYLSEDPYLTGILAASFIQGVEKHNVACCLKHFACNNQEALRQVSNSIVDERALYEIYLKPFEIATKLGKPSGMMTAYNRLNGIYLSNHKAILEDLARKKWGFDGIYVTDWGALDDVLESFKNGLDLEMPGLAKGSSDLVYEAVLKGEFEEAKLNEIVQRFIAFNLKSQAVKKGDFNLERALHLAKQMAIEGSVLLKNEANILPLKKDTKFCLIGQFAKKPRFEGGGSSKVNPIILKNLYDTFKENNYTFTYADGYKEDGSTNESLLNEAKVCAKGAETVLVMVGLPDHYESESYDRFSLDMPSGHLELISELCKVNPNIVVILSAGSVIHLPFEKDVKAILHGFLGGCMGHEALFELLVGQVSPSGKLAETYPYHFKDSPAYPYYHHDLRNVEYRESIFTGYRYYDFTEAVLYPFGHGLSYTSFEYANLNVQTYLKKDESLDFTFDLKNTGETDGKEIVQVYLSKVDSKIPRPIKELKEFSKIDLSSHSQKEVSIHLEYDAFSYYDATSHSFEVEEGEYLLLIGASSKDIRLEKRIFVEGIKPTLNIPEIYYHPNTIKQVSKSDFEALCGFEIKEEKLQKPYDRNITLNDLQKDSHLFKALIPLIKYIAKKLIKDEDARKMMEIMLLEMPIRTMSLNGNFNKYGVEGLVAIINGHPLKGIKLLNKKAKIK